MQEHFAKAFADEPGIRIPQVLHSLCRPYVLVSEWIVGDSFGALQRDADQHRLDATGEQLP